MRNMDLVYGLLLGEGNIIRSNTKIPVCRLRIAHGYKHLEYLQHKSEILEKELKFKSSIDVCKVTPPDSKGYEYYVLLTAKNRFWTEMRAKLYSFRNTPAKTRKRITTNILKVCTLRTLLYWFLDSGYNSPNGDEVRLFTYEYPYAEQELIKKWIYDITGAELTIRQSRERYYLSTTRDARIFLEALNTINPNIDCMQYKLNLSKETPDTSTKVEGTV